MTLIKTDLNGFCFSFLSVIISKIRVIRVLLIAHISQVVRIINANSLQYKPNVHKR